MRSNPTVCHLKVQFSTTPSVHGFFAFNLLCMHGATLQPICKLRYYEYQYTHNQLPDKDNMVTMATYVLSPFNTFFTCAFQVGSPQSRNLVESGKYVWVYVQVCICVFKYNQHFSTTIAFNITRCVHSGTPLNRHPSTADTHDIMDNSESLNCPSIHFNA